MEEHRPTSDGAGPSRTAASDARTPAPARLVDNSSTTTATGGVPRLEMGDSGEEQWHGESRKGSSPDTSSSPAYSLSFHPFPGQGCGDGTSLRLRIVFLR